MLSWRPPVEVRTVRSTPSPSRASVTSAQRKAATSDRRSPPMNSKPAITASSRPRRCAVVWDSTPRPSVRGRAAVARIAASPSARSGAAWPRPRSARVRRDALARPGSGAAGRGAAHELRLLFEGVTGIRRGGAGWLWRADRLDGRRAARGVLPRRREGSAVG